jgi:hypothetical protein
MSKFARILLLTLVVIGLARPALAGPPLLCHPFYTGAVPAALLPWGTDPGWNSPDARYDLRNLVADTTRLLTPDAPVLVRMENLRRAAIYASRDARLMAGLLDALTSRSEAAGGRDALAVFDAGYLIETYRQGTHLHRQTPGADGYAMVRRAIAMQGPSPDMEFAASLMKGGTAASEHRRRAEAGAAAGSPLARNLTMLGNY